MLAMIMILMMVEGGLPSPGIPVEQVKNEILLNLSGLLFSSSSAFLL